MHLGPILINGRATIGKDCTFHVNTAVVAGGTNDDLPTLYAVYGWDLERLLWAVYTLVKMV